MATTIRVYIDGGGSPYATAAMNVDRTFSVSVAGLANGTHTVEVTAQEDGKGESPRTIQTITVQHAGAAAVLAADLVATGTVTADLTAPGAATQHALSSSLYVTGTVTADLTLAFQALYADLSATAAVTADLTTGAGGGSVYPATDSFARPGYAAATTYATGAYVSAVTYRAWKCLVASTSQYPYSGVPSTWQDVTGSYTDAQIGALSAWASGTYTLNQIVRHNSGTPTKYYRSLAAGNVGNFPQWSLSQWVEDATLGPAWTQVPGTSAITAPTFAPSSGVGSVYFNAALPSAHQRSCASPPLSGASGPACRMNAAADSCYCLGVDAYDDQEGGGYTYLKIYKIAAGVRTQIATSTDLGVGASPAFVAIEANGTTISAYTGGALTGPWGSPVATATNQSDYPSGYLGQRSEGPVLGAWRGEELA